MFKTLAIAASVIAASASIASADNYFSAVDLKQEISNGEVSFGNVVSEGNGVVELYNFSGGEIGALIGTEEVRAGSNLNVEVDLDRLALTDTIAQLKVNGQVVATQEITIQR